MTDYLEELLDQLKEEDTGTAARWLDTLGPALAEPPGGAGLRELEREARRPAALGTASNPELSALVQAEAQGVLATSEDVEAFLPSDPPEDWAAAWSSVPPEGETPEIRILGYQEDPDWNVPQLDVLTEASREGVERPALLERARMLGVMEDAPARWDRRGAGTRRSAPQGRRRAGQLCPAWQSGSPAGGWSGERTMPRRWTGLFSGTAGAMTRALPCTEEGSAVRLTPMRYKSYTWPHNPRVYSIDYERKMAVHKVPFGLYHLQDLGRTRRVMEGEGEFVGADAYSQFGQLANVFYDSGPGLLVHPLWQTASAYFVALRLEQEPRPDYVRYSFTFWEDVSYYSGEVRTFAPDQDRRRWFRCGRRLPSGEAGGHLLVHCTAVRSVPGGAGRQKSTDPEPEPDPGGREGEDRLTGYVTTAQGVTTVLPTPVSWCFQYTSGVPCDSFRLRCIWDGDNQVKPEEWAMFQALKDGEVRFTGVVDECEILLGPEGAFFEVSGREWPPGCWTMRPSARTMSWQLQQTSCGTMWSHTASGQRAARRWDRYPGSLWPPAAASGPCCMNLPGIITGSAPASTGRGG